MTELPLPDLPETPPRAGGGPLHRLQSLLAMVIALAAIGLATWEGLENRKHNRLTVHPRLGGEVQSGRNSSGEYVRFAVESTGLGPAVVRSFRIYLDGQRLESGVAGGSTPWNSVIEAVASDGMSIDAHGFGAGYFMPAGREYVLFDARRQPGAEGTPPLSEMLGRIAVDICYCSIYGSDCDRVLLATTKFEVEACPR